MSAVRHFSMFRCAVSKTTRTENTNPLIGNGNKDSDRRYCSATFTNPTSTESQPSCQIYFKPSKEIMVLNKSSLWITRT